MYIVLWGAYAGVLYVIVGSIFRCAIWYCGEGGYSGVLNGIVVGIFRCAIWYFGKHIQVSYDIVREILSCI